MPSMNTKGSDVCEVGTVTDERMTRTRLELQW